MREEERVSLKSAEMGGHLYTAPPSKTRQRLFSNQLIFVTHNFNASFLDTFIKVVRLLLLMGESGGNAALHLWDKDEKTPRDIAEEQGFSELLEMFKEFQEKGGDEVHIREERYKEGITC